MRKTPISYGVKLVGLIKIVRTEKEFDINGTKVMAYSRKDAIIERSAGL